MSAFAAVMEIDSRKYHVVNFTYSVDRDYDFEGRPSSRPRNSIIEVEVVVPDGDVMFYKWLCFNEIKTGTIVFDKIDQQSKFNEIKFEQGFCLTYRHSFSELSSSAMTIAVKISAGILTITSGSEQFSNDFFSIT